MMFFGQLLHDGVKINSRVWASSLTIVIRYLFYFLDLGYLESISSASYINKEVSHAQGLDDLVQLQWPKVKVRPTAAFWVVWQRGSDLTSHILCPPWNQPQTLNLTASEELVHLKNLSCLKVLKLSEFLKSGHGFTKLIECQVQSLSFII